MTKLVKIFLLSTALLGINSTAGTLENTKKQGFVKCGISGDLPGFSEILSDGKHRGIDVDGCRIIAAAIFGDASKVKFVATRTTPLQTGEVDVLYNNTTWTQSRDTALGLNFAGTNYYDGQAFMVKKRLGIKSAKELNGATLCVRTGTTTELNVADYFRANKMTYQVNTYDTNAQVLKSYESGRCDILTSDASQLYSLRTKLKEPSKSIVLPEIISKEPLGPLVRQGDDAWFNIVKWTLNATIEAEELGVTSANVDKMKASRNPSMKRLLGSEGKMGSNLGLNADFAYNIIKQVGNYGEIFERNVGKNTPLKIERGINALWTKGGLHYSPPFR